MHSVKIKIGGIFLVCLFSTTVFSADDTEKNLSWLKKFFANGIHSASARYSDLLVGSPSDTSEQFHKSREYSVSYYFDEKKYYYQYNYVYIDFWSVLTNGNSGNPPKQETKFVGSKTNPWINYTENGYHLGKYSEQFIKELPNWFIFDDLDSLMINQCLMNNPLPPISGIFYADEFKALKRIYKEAINNNDNNSITSCFEFDHDGNVVGMSPAFLQGMTTINSWNDKKFDDYSINIRNNEGDMIDIEILSSKKRPLIMEGISISLDKDNEVDIFNFEINSLLNKFVPELISDPRILIQEYLVELQKESDKELMRFEATENK